MLSCFGVLTKLACCIDSQIIKANILIIIIIKMLPKMSNYIRALHPVHRLLLPLIILQIASSLITVNGEDTPAFPRLFEAADFGARQVRLLIELSPPQAGHTLLSQIDLDLSSENKVRYSRRQTLGGLEVPEETFYEEFATKLAYRYSGYSCELISRKESNSKTNDPFFRPDEPFQSTIRYKGGSPEADGATIYGMAALWLEAERLPAKARNFRRELVDSSLLGARVEALVWNFQLQGQQVNMYFVLEEGVKAPRLELIEWAPVGSDMVDGTRTVAMLLDLERGAFPAGSLGPPLGRGCHDKLATEMKLQSLPVSLDQLYAPVLDAHGSHLIEMEVSWHSSGKDDSGRKWERQSSSHIQLVSFRSPADSSHPGRFHYQLMSRRDGTRDTKLLVDYYLRLLHTVDLKRGSCQVSRLATESRLDPSVASEDSEQFVLELGEGHPLKQLFLDNHMLHLLFVDSAEFPFIRQNNLVSSGEEKQIYFERSVELWPTGSDKKVLNGRIIRSYRQENQSVELDYVTIYLFDRHYKELLQTINLNLMQMRRLQVENSRRQLARMLDLSEPCHLNSVSSLPGRHYAWLEFLYEPMEAHLVSHLARISQTSLSEAFYAHLEDRMALPVPRAPKIELELDSNRGAMIFRVLVLELPQWRLVLDEHKGVTVVEDPLQGDQVEAAVDEEHCADLCHAHRALVCSFCRRFHGCKISHRQPAAISTGSGRSNSTSTSTSATDDLIQVTKDDYCITWTLPGGHGLSHGDLDVLTLRKLVADLESSFYGHPLPDSLAAKLELPEELRLPMHETGIDGFTWQTLMRDYRSGLESVTRGAKRDLGEFSISIPAISMPFPLPGGQVVLLRPSSFQVGSDPEIELGLHSGDLVHLFADSQEASEVHFIKGLLARGFETGAGAGKLGWQTYLSISYEQCELACQDRPDECYSFSFCGYDDKGFCTITPVRDLMAAEASGQLETDPGCFIMQRDFLSKFHHFRASSHSPPTKSIGDQQRVLNPSQCAHICIDSDEGSAAGSEPNERCLAFDYCYQVMNSQEDASANKEGVTEEDPLEDISSSVSCYLLANRFSETDEMSLANSGSTQTTGNGSTSPLVCDHYERSYLADFLELPFRRLKKEVLDGMRYELLDGWTVDRCAERCAAHSSDCSALEFCFEPKADEAPGSRSQHCHLLEGFISDQAANELRKQVIGEDGSSHGQLSLESLPMTGSGPFQASAECRLFAMRRDTPLLRGRPHLLAALSANEAKRDMERAALDEANQVSGLFGGTLWTAIVLYLISTLVFACVGLAIFTAGQHWPMLRRPVGQMRGWLRL